jgi:hypothetical protein
MQYVDITLDVLANLGKGNSSRGGTGTDKNEKTRG